MIESLLCETCNILRRQEGTRDGDGWDDYTYNLESESKCLMLSNIGNRQETETNRDIVINRILYITDEIKEVDRIVYEGYEYRIIPNGVEEQKDLLSGTVQFYRVGIEKERVYPGETVEIK